MPSRCRLANRGFWMLATTRCHFSSSASTRLRSSSGLPVLTSAPWSSMRCMVCGSVSKSFNAALSCVTTSVRCAGRCEQCVPLRDVDTVDAGLGQRRHIGQGGNPLRPGHCQRAQAAGANMRPGAEQAGEHELGAADDGIVERRRSAEIGHAEHRRPAAVHEHLGGELRRRCAAGRRKAITIGLLAQLPQQVGNVVHRRLQVGDQQGRRSRHQTDGLEIAARVVVQLVQRRVHRMGADVAEHQGAAVGCRTCDEFAGNRAIGTGPVVDPHRPTQARCQAGGNRACHRVVAAAGGGRHDDGDRAFFAGHRRLAGGRSGEDIVGQVQFTLQDLARGAYQCGLLDLRVVALALHVDIDFDATLRVQYGNPAATTHHAHCRWPPFPAARMRSRHRPRRSPHARRGNAAA